MEFLNRIRQKIGNLEEKDFYKYLIIYFSALVLIVFVIILAYYLKVASLQESIDDINQMREGEIRTLLRRAEKVKKQRQEVNTVLAKDPNFKIKEFYEKALKRLNLTKFGKQREAKSKNVSDNYRESELKAELRGMNMKQLCELLDALEKTKRIYIKNVVIRRSEKTSRAIDVSLTIATLQPLKEKAT